MGTPYTYVKEVMGDASILKLAGSYPLPERKIREFASSVDRLFVVEASAESLARRMAAA